MGGVVVSWHANEARRRVDVPCHAHYEPGSMRTVALSRSGDVLVARRAPRVLVVCWWCVEACAAFWWCVVVGLGVIFD